MCFSPFLAIVTLSVATNLDGVWSALIIDSSRVLCFRAWSMISKSYLDLTFVLNRSCNHRPRDRHSSTCTIDSLVKWSSPWSCHFELKILSVFEWFCPNPLSAPRTTWILVPAPASRRLTSIERTFVSSSSSKYNGLPLGFPIFAVSACAVGLSFFYSLIDFW